MRELFFVTVDNASNTAKIFLILAIIWYIMAFATRRKRPVSTVLYAVFGTLFLGYGIYATIFSLLHFSADNKKGVILPILFIVVCLAVIVVGISVYQKRNEDDDLEFEKSYGANGESTEDESGDDKSDTEPIRHFR